MKERTQSLIFFVVLGVAGYFTYQYFIAPWLAGNASRGSSSGTSSSYLPVECQAEGDALRSAFYRHEELGNLTVSGLNGFERDYRRCLKYNTDFADSEIDGAVAIIRNSR